MNALLLLATLVAAAQPRPIIDTTNFTKGELRKLDEIIYMDGQRGETRVLKIVPSGDSYVVRCVVGRTQIDVPVTALRAVLFCDGSRIERANGDETASALNRAGKQVACEPIRIWRLKDTFMIDYRAAGQATRNHLYRFVRIPLGVTHVMRPGSNHIVEAWGWKRYRLGMNSDEIKRLRGEPERHSTRTALRYTKTLGVDLLLSSHLITYEIRFSSKTTGNLLTSGLGIGSRMDAALGWYGQPKRKVRCVKSGDLKYESGVLYDTGSSQVIQYTPKGLRLWFRGGRIIQVHVFLLRGRQYYTRPVEKDDR